MGIPPELLRLIQQGRLPIAGAGMSAGLTLDGRDNSHAAAALTRLPGLHQYEDGSEETVLDPRSPGATRENAMPLPPLNVVGERGGQPYELPANYARPPEGWEFPNGSTRGVPAFGELQLHSDRSRNVEDHREQALPPELLEALLAKMMGNGGEARRWMAESNNMRPQ